MNQAKQIYASTAASSLTNQSVRVFNPDCTAGEVSVVLNTASTSTVTVTIQGLRPGSTAAPYTILESTAITSTSVQRLRVALGATAVANQVVNDCLPLDMAVAVAMVGAETLDVSVGLNLIK